MSTDAWKSKPEKSHGRIETREIVVASADWLERKEEWTDIQAVIRYRCTRCHTWCVSAHFAEYEL